MILFSKHDKNEVNNTMIHYLSIGTLYSFWDDYHDDDFRVGYFMGGNEKFLLFSLVSTRGFDDGLYLTLNQNIFRADSSDEYTRRINRLFNIQGQKNRTLDKSFGEITGCNFCKTAQRHGEPLSIFINSGDTICGYVKNIFEDAVQLNKLNENGQDDGEALVLWECIEKYRMDSGEERIRIQLRM